MEIGEILRGNFWKIKKKEISEEILSFLSYFFNIKSDENFNEDTGEIEEFYILEKKKKFLYN